MRDELITHLKTLNLGTVKVSEELPFNKDGEPLYLKNFKSIYVDRPTLNQEGVINTLDGASLVNQETIVTAYLTVDAKNQPSNMDTIVSALRTAKGNVTTDARINRTVSVTQSYEGDALVTEFEYRFVELLTS